MYTYMYVDVVFEKKPPIRHPLVLLQLWCDAARAALLDWAAA